MKGSLHRHQRHVTTLNVPALMALSRDEPPIQPYFAWHLSRSGGSHLCLFLWLAVSSAPPHSREAAGGTQTKRRT